VSFASFANLIWAAEIVGASATCLSLRWPLYTISVTTIRTGMQFVGFEKRVSRMFEARVAVELYFRRAHLRLCAVRLSSELESPSPTRKF
jgi:hypothetical protein